METAIALAAALLVGLAIYVVRRTRARRLAAVRASWGRPVDRARRLPAITASHHARVLNIGATASLDDRTWADLNLDEVFTAIDRTQSTLGQHALYHRLRTAPGTDDLNSFELLVRRFGDDGSARERAQMALAPLQDPQGYDLWWLARPDAIETRSWYVIFPAMTIGTMVLLGLAAVWHQLVPLAVLVVGANVALRWAVTHQIDALTVAFRQLPSVIGAGDALHFLDGDDHRPGPRGLRAAGQRLRRLKTTTRWITSNPFLLPMHSGSVALFLNDVLNTVFEYLNGALLLDATGVYLCAGELRRHGAALAELAAAVGDIDVALSVASLRAGRGVWTVPLFRHHGAAAIMADICHPLVSDAVPNTIALRPGAGALITGSNMSGKSTFLRTIGVTTVMAQTLNTCFASAYEAPVLRVRSCIGRTDDLAAGKSYYLVEVESLLDLVESSASSAPHLYLLDEVFRGTNATERIAAGEAVLRELLDGAARPNPHIVVAATHDGELVDLLTEVYDAFHFGDELREDGLVFDHRLQHGPATTRNAIALLHLHGAPDALVRRALSRAAVLDTERGKGLAERSIIRADGTR